MEKKKKIIQKVKVAFLLLFLAVFIGTAVLFGIGIYTYAHIDYSIDEALFSAAKTDKVSRLYYDGGMVPSGLIEKLETLHIGETDDVYTPIEYATVWGEEKRIWQPLEKMPDYLINAFVAIEDKRFFEHQGVDVWRTACAVANYFLHFDSRFGASTITQQVIKNLSSDDEITPQRKLREICRAIHIEQAHEKEEILEVYLNIVPLSEGCVGVGAAAQTYFGKEVSELTLEEAATLAAITNLPSYYDPSTHPENNEKRRNLILEEMKNNGYITQKECEEAQRKEILTQKIVTAKNNVWDWYTETVLASVANDLKEKYELSDAAAWQLIYNGGLKIYTSQNRAMQNVLTAYFEDESNLPDGMKNGMNCAMVVLSPDSGNVLAIVGGAGKKETNRILNYATQTYRAPGSSIKPLSVYAPALEERKITAATVFDDVPLTCSASGVMWPRNSPSVYSGLTDLQTAIALSKNTVSVRTLREIGTKTSFSYLRNKLHFSKVIEKQTGAGGNMLTDMEEAPLALGQLSNGASVLEMCAGYATLASGGVYRAPRVYVCVLDSEGNELLSANTFSERVFRVGTTAVMSKLLSAVVNEGTASSLQLQNIVSTAGKTGTSGEGEDKWFIGYTPYCVAGIWCGYENGAQIVQKSDSKFHLRAWDEVMCKIHQSFTSALYERKNFIGVEDLVPCAVCRDSGKIPCEGCRADARGNRTVIRWFERGTEPQTLCDCHVLVPYEEGNGVVFDGEAETVSYVGMIQVKNRCFNSQVIITDAQYVYEKLDENTKPAQNENQPFFYQQIEQGKYVGISETKDGRQFNRAATNKTDKEKEKTFFEEIHRFFERLFS